MATANYTQIAPTRNYRRPITRAERAILRIEQKKAAARRQSQPVQPVATPPSNPMSAGKKARLAAFMADLKAQQEVA